MSKKLSSILIQTIIWIGLMRVSLWYLHNHAAERVWIFSTFDFFYQKIQWATKVFDWWSKSDVNDLDQFKTSFKELKQVTSVVECQKALKDNNISTQSIDDVLAQLETASAEDFNREKSRYISIFNRETQDINKFCK